LGQNYTLPKTLRKQCWELIDSLAGVQRFKSLPKRLRSGKKEPYMRSIEIRFIAFEMTVPQLFRSV